MPSIARRMFLATLPPGMCVLLVSGSRFPEKFALVSFGLACMELHGLFGVVLKLLRIVCLGLDGLTCIVWLGRWMSRCSLNLEKNVILCMSLNLGWTCIHTSMITGIENRIDIFN